MENEATPSDDFTAAELETYLPAKLGAGAVEVVDVEKFPRGVSRETWFVRFKVDANAEEEQVVLRRDLPGGSICVSSLRFEYDIYEKLGRSDVPVSDVLWFEDDPSNMPGGREFFVRRHVEGDWSIPDLHNPDPAFTELRVEMAREHVRKIALVHQVDWQGLGFDQIMEVPPSPQKCASTVVNGLMREIEKIKNQPLPMLTEAQDFLLENQPVPTGVVCLIKGTNGLGEEVFRDGEIVAMSDWELACLGDPALDFAQMQEFAAQVKDGDDNIVWDMQHALAYYQELTGTSVNPGTVMFYQLMYGLHMALQSQSAASSILDGSDKLARLAWVGSEILHRAQQIYGFAMGLTAPPERVPGQLG